MQQLRYVDPTTGLLGAGFPLPLDSPFTRAMAIRQGLDPRWLPRLCDAGLLRRMLRGVYVATQVEETLLLRAMALGLVVPEGMVVVDRTAGWLHGADHILAPNDHLAVPRVSMFSEHPGRRLRNELASSGERTLLPRDITVVHGIRVTTPLRTTLDLGRLLRRDQAMAAIDAMLRVGVDKRELEGSIERFKGERGVRQLRELAPLGDERSQSQGESVLRLRWRDTPGLPVPVPQVPVRGPDGWFYLDLGAEAVRFAAEYDGEAFHGALQQEHDTQRRAWCEAEMGWVITVARKHNVFGPKQDIQQMLRADFARALRRLPTAKWTG